MSGAGIARGRLIEVCRQMRWSSYGCVRPSGTNQTDESSTPTTGMGMGGCMERVSSSRGYQRRRFERKAWRKDHPFGFYARPVPTGDGATNIMKWDTGIPGKEATDWAGGVYKVTLEFNEVRASSPI
eukprot:scaffold12260_cov49-Attheya_sp.AAC.2